MKVLMPVLFLALLVVGAIAPAATEAEAEKEINLLLDMSISEVKELAGKPITQVTLADTTVLSYDDVKLLFRDDKLAGELAETWENPLIPVPGLGCEHLKTKTKQEVRRMMLERFGVPPEYIKKYKGSRSMRSGQAEPETIELTLGMSREEVKKLKGRPKAIISYEIGDNNLNGCSTLQGLFLLHEYDDINIVFRDGKLFSVR